MRVESKSWDSYAGQLLEDSCWGGDGAQRGPALLPTAPPSDLSTGGLCRT